jgi:DNA-binding MarR family transcriptional regulator
MMIDELKLENQLCFAVYAFSREITKIYRPYLEPLGLTYTQYLVMIVLWEKDGISLKELGSKLNLDSGTLTPLLKKLENDGNIVRARDKKDERNLIIHLTDAGRELMTVAENIPDNIACNLPMDLDDIVSLRDKIKTILTEIEKVEKLKS